MSKIMLGITLVACFMALQRQDCAAQENSFAVTQSLAHGDEFLKDRDFDNALEAYRKADKLAHHQCAECNLRMFRADRQKGDLGAALDDAKRAVKAAGDDKNWAAQGHLARGSLLAQMAGKSSDKKLQQAEQEMREALALNPAITLVRFNLGIILIKQERDQEGVEELKAFVAAPGSANPRSVSVARSYIASPIRAREPFAPDFSFTTLEGEKISNAALRGKVVLLDFWGTWCPPCRESVPMLLDIRKKYANRPFQMVGISSDDNEQAWKAFIAGHRMDWPEYIDLSQEVLSQFSIDSFPTYIVLDRDGVIRFRQSGLSEISGQELQDAINQSLKRPSNPNLVAATTTPASSNPDPVVEPKPKPTPAAAEEKVEAESPKDDNDVEDGEVAENVYQNESLGLSYEFPVGWTAAKSEDLHAANERVAASMKSSMPQSASGASQRIAIPKTILYASQIGRGDGQSIVPPCVRLSAMPWSGPQLTVETVKAMAERMKPQGTEIARTTEVLTVDEQEFFRTDFMATQNGRQIWVSQIETIANGHRVTLEIFAMSQDHLDRVATSVKSMAFKKQ